MSLPHSNHKEFKEMFDGFFAAHKEMKENEERNRVERLGHKLPEVREDDLQTNGARDRGETA
jgi:hypothetical protein